MILFSWGEKLVIIHIVISWWRGSNAQKTGAPGAIPTRDLSLRRRALYAAELREHRV